MELKPCGGILELFYPAGSEPKLCNINEFFLFVLYKGIENCSIYVAGCEEQSVLTVSLQ